MKQFKVGILLFDDVDVLDFAGPYEVFNLSVFSVEDVQKLFLNQLDNKDRPFLVHTVSEDGESIRVHNGLVFDEAMSLRTADTIEFTTME